MIVPMQRSMARRSMPLHADGTMTLMDGSVGWGARGDSGCLEMKGNGFIALTTRSELQLTGPLTVAGFIRMDQTPIGYVGVYWNLGGSLGLEVVLSYESRAYGQIGVGGTTVQVEMGTPLEGAWTHLAMVFEPIMRVEVFRDGKSVGKSIPPAGMANPNPNGIRLGPVTSGATWMGALDDVVVYSRALSAGEIAALAQR
jgi:hypothetical protein